MQNFYLITVAILLGYIIYKRFDFIGNKNVKSVSAEEAYKLIKENKDIIILDVRTPFEYKSGHIKGAKSLPVANFATGLKQFESYKYKPILVHCASGGRSPAAVRFLLSDKSMCQDLLETEKYISSTYNNTIFECTDANVRSVLNRIQKDEQKIQKREVNR